MPLYGHEIDHDISPVEGGLAWTISLEKKEDYVGRSVIEEHMRAGPPRRLIFFMLEERRIAREGAPVFAGREQVGEVRSGTQSPSLNKPIGSALVGGEAGDEELEVEIRTKRYALRVTQPPLHTALQ
jgi:aminomethyltransferase